MKRHTFFSGMTVTPADMNDDLQDSIEKADARGLDAVSLGKFPIKGLAPTTSGADLVVSVSAGTGLAADGDGDALLVRLLAPATKDLAPYTPAVNPKWVALVLRFVRNDSDQTLDDEDATVEYTNDEGSILDVVQGAEGGGKPAIPANVVPIADFRLTVGQAALHQKDVDCSRARPTNGRQGTAGGVAAQMGDVLAAAVDNCRVYATEPADMNVHVRPGRVNFDGKSIAVAAADLALVASPTAGNKRVALIYIAADGSVNVAYGDEVPVANNAVPPSHTGKIALAEITLLHTTTEVLTTDVVDVRPFLKGSALAPDRFLLDPAVGGETVIALGFNYSPGTHTLEVFKDGVKLIVGDDYAETNDHTITLLVAMVAGHKLEVIAPSREPVDPSDFSMMGGLVAPGFKMQTTGDHSIVIEPFSAVINGKLRSTSANIVLGAQVSNLPANAWAYVYAFWDGAAVQIEVSATGPDLATRRTKAGDATRTYLAAIRTCSGGAGNPALRAFSRVNRTTTWQFDDSDGNTDHALCPV